MIDIGDILNNRTVCDIFGVANMGGIRVNKSRNLIVLISNNVEATYLNVWRGNVLHFVGIGTVGPQKLDRQNKTLANANRNGTALHLFEVSEKGRYVYVGQVERADEPYRSDQRDSRYDERFVWVFPLRRKPDTTASEVHLTPAPECLVNGLSSARRICRHHI
jgi:5-methylcytosine-specific restriction protein A